MDIKHPTAYAATLPCETLMSVKQAIKDKLQGIVATYLRCGGVVNNQTKTGLLLHYLVICRYGLLLLTLMFHKVV